MKLLADMGVSPLTAAAARARGHDVGHLRDRKLESATDETIVAMARAEGRVIVTFDLDFGALLAAGLDRDPSVILIRMEDERPERVSTRLLTALEEAKADLEHGAIVVIEDRRFRVRRLPIHSEDASSSGRHDARSE